MFVCAFTGVAVGLFSQECMETGMGIRGSWCILEGISLRDGRFYLLLQWLGEYGHIVLVTFAFNQMSHLETRSNRKSSWHTFTNRYQICIYLRPRISPHPTTTFFTFFHALLFFVVGASSSKCTASRRPLQMSISSSLTNLVLFQNLYTTKSMTKTGRRM